MMPGPRRAYSYCTAAADYSVSIKTLHAAVQAGKVRAREAHGCVLLNPEDLEREFGFAPPPRRMPSAEARAIVREILGR